jgi:hypothetical protein
MKKIVRPCCWATDRRTEKDRPLPHEGGRVDLLEVEDLEQVVDGGLSAKRRVHAPEPRPRSGA